MQFPNHPRATMGIFQRAASIRRTIVQNFTAKQCMMPMAMKHPADTDKSQILKP